MTVYELIKRLQKIPNQNLPVMFGYSNYYEDSDGYMESYEVQTEVNEVNYSYTDFGKQVALLTE